MKSCDEIQELLSLYIDNELEEERAKLVREHVESCSSCKSELEQLFEVVKMCNDITEVELPENFKDALNQKLKSEQKKIDDGKKITVMRNRIMKTITSVAAIFLIVFAVRGFFNTGKYSKSADSSAYNMKQESVSSNIVENKRKEKNIAAMPEFTSEQIVAYNSEADEGSSSVDEFGGVSGVEAGANDNALAGSINDSQENSDGNRKYWKEEEQIITTMDTSDPAEIGADQEPPIDNGVTTEFSQDISPTDGFYSMAKGSEGNQTENDIQLTANSKNIESDKLKINEIAGKYGTMIEDSAVVFSDQPKMAGSTEKYDQEFGASILKDYTVSYDMDKSNYEKFVKEIQSEFYGKYDVTSQEEKLNRRLKTLENSISVLESKESFNSEELKNLIEEKEKILMNLESIKSNQQIKVNITIYSEK